MSTVNTDNHIPVGVVVEKVVQTSLELIKQVLVWYLVARTHDRPVVDTRSLEISGVVVLGGEGQVEDKAQSLPVVGTSPHGFDAILRGEPVGRSI